MFDKKRFIKTAIVLALPIIMQNTLTMVVNMIDTVMLSSYGDIQISASSLANDLINLFQILCMGAGSGAAVLTAQYWGNNNITDLKKAIVMMLKVSLTIGFTFSIIVLFFSKQLMMIYSNDLEVIEFGAIYFIYSIPTFLLMAITVTISQILRSIRKVKIPLYASIISVLVNVVANWIFIFGNLGMPEMQIAGAALGTVIARVVETIIIWTYLLHIEKEIRFSVKDMLIDTHSIQNVYIKYSVPVIISDMFLGLGNSATSIVIGHIGTTFASANSIVAMVQRISTVFTQGLGNASHTLIGNTIGENDIESAKKQANLLLKLGLFFGVLSASLIFGTKPLVLLYFNNLSFETLKIASKLLNALSIMIVFQAMQSLITKGILRGGGDTDYCLKIDAVYMWLISIPLGILSGLILHLDPFIILISLKLDWIIKTILGIKRIISGKWIKNIN